MTSWFIPTFLAPRAQRLAALRALPFTLVSAVTIAVSFGSVFAQDDVSNTSASVTLTPSDLALNIDTCELISEETEFTLSGSYAPTFAGSFEVDLVATTGSNCSREEVCNEVALDGGSCSCLKRVQAQGSIDNPVSASLSFKVQDLFDEPCVAGEERVVSFFLNYKEEVADDAITEPVEGQSNAVQLDVDLKAPNAPTEAPTVSPAEEALKVDISEVGGDVSSYKVCVRELGVEAAFDRCKSVSPNETLRFDELQNNVTYEVVYIAKDDAGNESEESPIAQGTPASVLDFAEVYSQQYPGGELGGCESHSGPAPLWVLLLSLFALGRRRLSTRVKISSVAYGLLMVIISPLNDGWAEPWDISGSDRTTTVTFQAGSYLPAIDSEFQERPNTPRPYELVFQNDAPLMFMMQADRHLLQRYGTLSVGGSVGYWNVEGESISQESDVKETTEMSIYPFAVSVNYRFDMYQQMFPLVPVIKLGLNYYLWTVYDGSGEPARFVDGSEASGVTLGYSYTLGVHFLLDALDREMAWAFDRDAGVNHSYISLEYQSSQVDDFGSPTSFRLGSEVFFIGLALDI